MVRASLADPARTQIRGIPSLRPRMKVLSIDGGGIRGLIPALVLAEIERRTGRRTAEMFDLIAGTSTGGILACGLTRRGEDGQPMHSAEELAELYMSEGPKIFDRSLVKQVTSLGGLIDERYDDAGLNAALETYLGPARLKEVLCDVFITAYDIQRPLRVLLPLLAGAHGRRVRLLARRGGARDVRRAHLLRADRGHGRRRRAHLPADRRRDLRGQPGDVRLRRGGRRAAPSSRSSPRSAPARRRSPTSSTTSRAGARSSGCGR